MKSVIQLLLLPNATNKILVLLMGLKLLLRLTLLLLTRSTMVLSVIALLSVKLVVYKQALYVQDIPHFSTLMFDWIGKQ